MTENKDIIKGMKNKTYVEITDEEEKLLPLIMRKLNLSIDEQNYVFLAFLFNDTIYHALSIVRPV